MARWRMVAAGALAMGLGAMPVAAAPGSGHAEAIRALHEALEIQARPPTAPPQLPMRAIEASKGPTKPLPPTAAKAAVEARAAAVLRKAEKVAKRHAERLAGDTASPSLRGAHAADVETKAKDGAVHGGTLPTTPAQATAQRRGPAAPGPGGGQANPNAGNGGKDKGKGGT